jgi:hypothetical protein
VGGLAQDAAAERGGGHVQGVGGGPGDISDGSRVGPGQVADLRRHDHRLKQHPKWRVDQLPDGTFRWTTPAGRTYTTEPTRYPI